MLDGLGYDGWRRHGGSWGARTVGRRAALLPVALGLLSALALGTACVATARQQKIIGMPLNSTLLLAGSKVACGSGVKGGNGFNDCGIAGSDGKPKRGSYFVLMTMAEG